MCDAQFRYAVFLTVITFNVRQLPNLYIVCPAHLLAMTLCTLLC